MDLLHKRTVDAAMEVTQYTEPHLNTGVAIIISTDVQRAFGSAWWPAILETRQNAPGTYD